MSRVQVRFAPTEYDEGVTVWADVVPDDDAINVVLPHSYPDPVPEMGWWLAYNGRDYEVIWVDDRQPYQLECRLKSCP